MSACARIPPARRRLLGVALLCAALCSVATLRAVPASADIFGPISLVSDGPLGSGAPQQAEYAHDTAISANGEYVVFDGSIGGIAGVWRRDLRSGALQQVAGGDAEQPSISADGQYVSFTTNEGASLAAITRTLTGEPPHGSTQGKEAVNVYVRDMALEPNGARAFVLASAQNASAQPLTYEALEPDKYGSVAIGRSAIDAEGDEVAFVTTAVSNLVRYPQIEAEEEAKGEVPKPHTPPLQVAVRYLGTDETKLVSRCYVECEAAAAPAVGSVEGSQAYGAVYPGESTGFQPPPPYGAYSGSPPTGASLSADGSTVAWMGENVRQQAPMLPAEHEPLNYAEPLWRRVQPGSETPTERVTGGSDPSAPGCAASGESSLPPLPSPSDPCAGPFVAVSPEVHVSGILSDGSQGAFVPRLSANGQIVAFASEAPLLSLGENFGRERTGQPSDLYVADMAPGLTRDQALEPLTELAGGANAGAAATAPVFDFEISPDGAQVAFSTRRTQFILGSPAFVSPQAGEPGLNELFDANLRDATLTRVTHGFLGPVEPAEHPHQAKAPGVEPYIEPGDGALSPSFTVDGSVIAFSSTASNLVFDDTNAPPAEASGPLDGSDAFVVEHVAFHSQPTPQDVSPGPPLALAPAWQLGVSAFSRGDGSVVLYVGAPGAGTLRARARAAVRSGRSAPSGARVRSRARRAARARSHARQAGVVAREIASAHASIPAGNAEPVALVLRLAKPYAALASQPDGQSASVTLTFAAKGGSTLRTSIEVRFARAARPSRRPPRDARRSQARGRER